jgi:predicted nucleic acid-binding Zn ribbon protein
LSRRAPRPLAVALEDLSATLAPRTVLALVQEAWPAVAGPAIAAAARPTSERDGVLTLTCEAAVWAHELDMLAPELIARLNSALREHTITALRCRTG